MTREELPIAIVGIGGVFPDAPDPAALWANVLRGRAAAREVPAGRWPVDPGDVYDPEIAKHDRVYSLRGCFIETVPDVDTAGVRLDRDFLSALDPAFHLLLHAGWNAWLDARTDDVDLDRVSAVFGNIALPTEHATQIAQHYVGRTFEEKILGHSRLGTHAAVHPANATPAGLPAAVLAEALGLGGGAMTLDAACASSLYAVKVACDELRAGRADAVVTGGLSRPDSLYTQMGFSQLRALSPSGRCAPFDVNGDGLVVGEGAGVVVLKRVDDALRHGDTIYAVIRGIGLSNDVGGGLLAPVTEGQVRAMRRAYRAAGLSPRDIDLVECHATGTPVGDKTELESLQEVWGTDGWKPGQCVLGSVKSNVGHLLTAAGAVALIKTVLALQSRTLPPTANCEQPIGELREGQGPFRVLSKPEPWTARGDGIPRRAAVSAFGFGGINAHLILEEFDTEPAQQSGRAKRPPAQEPPPAVAVVGLELAAGPWRSARAFQERLFSNGAGEPPTPPQRWRSAEQSGWYRIEGLSNQTFGGFYIDDFDFPLDRFRIPPRELEEMLPQQLLMLRVAAGALDNYAAGRGQARDDPSQADPDTGVFIGIELDQNTTNYSLRWQLRRHARKWASELQLALTEDEFASWLEALQDEMSPLLTANRVMGGLGSIVASRIAREFRFGGPSFTVSAEENSGMRALELAVRALQTHTVDRALAGAIDLHGDIRAVLSGHTLRPWSSGGTARPFDPLADGAAIGEAAVALVLKRYTDAVKSGDRILAVIRGVGAASAGHRAGTRPEPRAYLRAVERAWHEAGADPASMAYLEGHGSGVPGEDAVESRACARLFAGRSDAHCHISAVKADAGHTGAASSLLAVAKASLCLYHGVLPNLRNSERLRDEFSAAGSTLRSSTAQQHWLRDRAGGPRRAGVSSISFGGNFGHVALEEYQRHAAHERLRPIRRRAEALFAVEANTRPALETALGRLRAFVESARHHPVDTLGRLWWCRNHEDPAKSYGMAFVARDAQELLNQIDYVLHVINELPEKFVPGGTFAGAPPFVRERVFFSPEPLAKSGEIAFVYPGSGNHFPGMGRDLALEWPEILRRQDEENANLRSQYQPAVFWDGGAAEAVNHNAQAALFGQVALGTAVTDVIRTFGVQPKAVIGYSLGETAGLFAMRAWTDRDLMLHRINESTLFTEDLAGEYKAARSLWKVPSNKTVDWALGVIDRPAKVVRAALQDHKKVYNLIVNTLHECVVGGDRNAVEKLVKKLDCEFFPLHGVTAVHCEVAKEVQKPYRALHVLPATPPKGVRFYSGAWGTAYNVSSESAADSVLAQAIYGIDYPKVIEAAYDDGVRIFLEMGPGGSCTRMIGEILGDRPHVVRTASQPGLGALTSVLRMLGQLIAERVPVDLSVLYGEDPIDDESFITDPGRTMKVRSGLGPFRTVLPERKQRESVDAAPPVEPAAVAPSMPVSIGFDAPVERSALDFVRVPVDSVNFGAASAVDVPADAAVTNLALPECRVPEAIAAANAEAHEAFLRVSDQTHRALAESIQLQMHIVENLLRTSGPNVPEPGRGVQGESVQRTPNTGSKPLPVPALDRAACLEFAFGSIARALGPEYAEIDSHPTRVRLPAEPLMLVDRIIEFEGTPRSLQSGRVITEHDVAPGAWYLDGRRAPTCIAVEAGQADLMLSAWLGIDFQTRGWAMYRLLDAAVTFHRGLPVAGETVRYDIRLERFIRQGPTWLFRFNFDATVDGEPLLSMRDGCAGFFTREQLDAGEGLVDSRRGDTGTTGTGPPDACIFVAMQCETLSAGQLDALREGDLVRAFGAAFSGLALQQIPRLPAGRMRLVEEITHLDPHGGRYGRGFVRGEMAVHPDDWFLTCHFVDDMVMPGTLMYECCLHTLRVFLMRAGWIGEAGDCAFEPVPGVTSRLQCRGEVNPASERVAYDVSIKEMGYRPEPYAIADAVMQVDGKPAIEMTGMSLQLTGSSRERLAALWSRAPHGNGRRGRTRYDKASILAFSRGKPSEAFGPQYAPFDHGRYVARLPHPPFQFIDRVIEVNAPAWTMKPGGPIVAEYDVPPDAWYFEANRAGLMPYAVLLEAPLQACGWFAAYMGSALTNGHDLYFRNLGGTATQHNAVTPASGTLRSTVTCGNVAHSGGMIIQNYSFSVHNGSELILNGDTYFGFFSLDALRNQVGLRDPQLYWAGGPSRRDGFPYPDEAPYPGGMLRMVDHIDVYEPAGGPHGLGLIAGSIAVDPSAWFFDAHFYQDPVWPGSLGLEGLLQLLKFAATERWRVGAAPRLDAVVPGERHAWTYRGQVTPANSEVSIQAAITYVDDDRQLLRADGFLSVDGKPIYHVQDFSVRLIEPGS